MRQLLRLHQDSRCSAAIQIEVNVTRPSAGILALSYDVTGKLGDVHLPPVTAAVRSDELWRHTCFEALIRASTASEYYEFNFAPSTQWAAYRFNGYRSGMCVASEISALVIEVRSSPDSYTLQVSLELDRLTALPREALWYFGLSAVIEDASGCKSHWALAHPPGKPDFHHTDCFTQELSPTVQL